jgi:hypothetical protein
MVNSRPISVEVLKHMLATCLQVSGSLSQSARLFGDDRSNCEAT